MNISQRQDTILKALIKSYIDLAEPVSSEYLKNKCHFDFSPATIRLEMQELTDMGFIEQPYTSSGRVPTDKGYRFFVDSLEEKDYQKKKIDERVFSFKLFDLSFIHEYNRLLASLSSTLIVTYLLNDRLFIKEGWKEAFNAPDFSETKKVRDFASMVDDFENNIDVFDLEYSSIDTYIGKEIPITKFDDFSIIISRCSFVETGDGLIAILGPKRMAYDKNIFLIRSVIEELNNKNYG